MNEELTNEALEAMAKCGLDCARCGSELCNKYDWQDIVQTLATALLEERAKPKVWDGAPDNATVAVVDFKRTCGDLLEPLSFEAYTRELPKTRARQIAENIVHGIYEGANGKGYRIRGRRSKQIRGRTGWEGMTLPEAAVQFYGAESQVRKAVEELTELSVALLHSLDGRGDTENIREEMADVEIMLEQLHVIFGYGDYRLVKECQLAERLKE